MDLLWSHLVAMRQYSFTSCLSKHLYLSTIVLAGKHVAGIYISLINGS